MLAQQTAQRFALASATISISNTPFMYVRALGFLCHNPDAFNYAKVVLLNPKLMNWAMEHLSNGSVPPEKPEKFQQVAEILQRHSRAKEWAKCVLQHKEAFAWAVQNYNSLNISNDNSTKNYFMSINEQKATPKPEPANTQGRAETQSTQDADNGTVRQLTPPGSVRQPTPSGSVRQPTPAPPQGN